MVYSVSDLNRFIKQMFSYEELFMNIAVEGEVSNYCLHSKTGNVYFTLKDEKSLIKCVIFKEQADLMEFFLEDGMFVVVRGDVSVYERFGRYQIYVSSVKEKGEGLISRNLKELTAKLFSEGLFSSSRKLEIPEIPSVVGVLTAFSGAALHDVVEILRRRLPILKIKIYSSYVQGVNAENSLCEALDVASRDDELDVLIIGRGGGSQEDLSAFNSEKFIRKVAEFKKPVISAVGHEINVCLLDYVADLRASTPSQAAEMVCLSAKEIRRRISDMKILMATYINSEINEHCFKINRIRSEIKSLFLSKVLSGFEEKIKRIKRDLKSLICERYDYFSGVIENRFKMLKILNPVNSFKRGYFLALNETGKIVKRALNEKVGDILYLKFDDGNLKVKVVEKIKMVGEVE